MSICTCSETEYIDLTGLPRRVVNPLHDCDYVQARNALIPFATKVATIKGVFSPAAFTHEMNRLWEARNV